MRYLFLSAMALLAVIAMAPAAEAGNCYGPKVLQRIIGAGNADYDRFFTLCPGQAIISIDGTSAQDQLGMYVQVGQSGPVVCNRQFAADSHTCTFRVGRKARYYVRVFNYGSRHATYRFISN
ncbi:hypothetical protein [Acuticoccus kandeliae]|uniref:hypothetical protein n=1 Tax=Acuticoccus kandeliae TaxID=2073160 RepID=UPI000D3ED654|nr:hypothetical protein [Acuticoccus kandeliae]